MPKGSQGQKRTSDLSDFDTLEAFVNEGVRRSALKGYHPTVFLEMRQNHSLEEVIRRLVESSEIQSGFTRLKKIGLLDWSLEAAVIRFPEEFSRKTREYAGFRISQAKGRILRGPL